MPPLESLIAPAPASKPFDIQQIRANFPALHQEVYGTRLVYLDNAATSQKPQAMIDRLAEYYGHENSNVHRGVHYLSQQATEAYEGARKKIGGFINVPDQREIIFTRGTTEGINLVAQSFGRKVLSPGDEVVISTMEHHSNIVPWQLICEATGAHLRVAPISDTGEIIYDEYLRLLTDRTKIVAVAHVSNSLGTVNPVKRMIRDAHSIGAAVLLDGAQAVPHMRVDVKNLDCDFFCFSGHKMFGPTGIGILYGKENLLEKMPPFQGGGDMIETVSFGGTTYNELPHKFEAGTPNIADAIALGATIDYINGIGMEGIACHEHDLLGYATTQLTAVDGLRLVGTAREKASVLSFLLDGIHPYDAGTILDRLGIAVRTGHHCTQPLMKRFGIPGTVRASFALYNTREEVDRLVAGILRVKKMFA